MRPVFVNKAVALLIENYFKKSSDVDYFIKSFGSSISGCEKLIGALRENKILVSSELRESEIIKMFRNNYTGNPYSSIMYIISTDQCNLRCEYCAIIHKFNQNYVSTRMSTETALKALDLFSSCCKSDPKRFEQEKAIIFYGGEPLLNTRVLEAVLLNVKKMKNSGKLPSSTAVQIITNGTLLTKEVATLLKENNVVVSISIDGNEEIHNACRKYIDGGPSFVDVMKGVRNCEELGIGIGVSCTLSVESINNFNSTLDMLLNKIKVKNLGFNIVLKNRNYSLHGDYEYEATQKIIEAYKIFRRLGIYEDRMMRKVKSFASGQVWPFDCAASGGNQIAIAPDGQVGVCHHYLNSRKYFQANVYNPLANPLIMPAMKEWSNRTPLSIKKCYDCEALGICGGGCPMYAEELTGSIWGLDSRFCVHSKMILEWMIWDLYDQMEKV
ncbi:MAG: Radical SAM additional 4Fe4S-binding domain protein [Candidatus Moranbacteria bacterium GW2011_GWF2_35_39]|nr:MAG: Radical SAM additional 4Fe4S-binding domain protein [Candidatus Moranbacteria bacterium GW2011_GWF2_35_39]